MGVWEAWVDGIQVFCGNQCADGFWGPILNRLPRRSIRRSARGNRLYAPLAKGSKPVYLRADAVSQARSNLGFLLAKITCDTVNALI